MKHVHHDMIVAWAADPSRVVEVRTKNGEEWFILEAPTWVEYLLYRFKPAEPKYIVVNGIQVPEPVRGKLEDDQRVWLADISLAIPCHINWLDDTTQRRWLSLGLIHLTKEAAQTHIDAMLLPLRTDK